jgi:hypothetical protein
VCPAAARPPGRYLVLSDGSNTGLGKGAKKRAIDRYHSGPPALLLGS